MRRKSWDDDEEQKRTPCLALFAVSLITFICLNVIGAVSNHKYYRNFKFAENCPQSIHKISRCKTDEIQTAMFGAHPIF